MVADMSSSAADATTRTTAPIDVIAAIHHPVRRRLLELLHLDGPNTVSGLAESAGERVGNASHHLKVLAEAGLVEEAPELAKDRRERWWRGTPGSVSWSVADVQGDPVAEVVATAAEQQNLHHHVGKVQQWYGRRGGFDESWVRAAFSTEYWVSVTPDELAELGRRVNALFEEYAAVPERSADPDRERAFVFAHGVPAQP
jgi:DNA-binding transcriptional ArsR family regulator